ncbi:hypothetical protein OQI87_06335 [Lactobacillus kefiranofaciens]|nr:hypothetical protein [Lactobacillus kefiranofaciens]MDH5100740.1 hypothetical protein [Lactobacillus kefiranofaciens]
MDEAPEKNKLIQIKLPESTKAKLREDELEVLGYLPYKLYKLH